MRRKKEKKIVWIIIQIYRNFKKTKEDHAQIVQEANI